MFALSRTYSWRLPCKCHSRTTFASQGMALHPPPLQNAEKIQQRALMTTQKTKLFQMMFNPKKDIVFSWRYDLFISKDQTSTQQKPHFHSGVSGKASMSEENCYLYTLYGPLRLWTPNLRSLTCGLPSGKHTENYGKSPFVMGKSTISMAMFHSKRGYIQSLDQLIIYSKLLVITRGYINHIHRLSIDYP